LTTPLPAARRARALWAVTALGALLGVAAATATATAVAAAATCPAAPEGATAVVLAVDRGSGVPDIRCVIVPTRSTGADVLIAAYGPGGVRSDDPRRGPGFVCAIGGHPAAPECADVGQWYWSYWQGGPDGWTYARIGAFGNRLTASCVVEGWRFGPTAEPPRVDPRTLACGTAPPVTAPAVPPPAVPVPPPVGGPVPSGSPGPTSPPGAAAGAPAGTGMPVPGVPPAGEVVPTPLPELEPEPGSAGSDGATAAVEGATAEMPGDPSVDAPAGSAHGAAGAGSAVDEAAAGVTVAADGDDGPGAGLVVGVLAAVLLVVTAVIGGRRARRREAGAG
jgi:hypothetical protein